MSARRSNVPAHQDRPFRTLTLSPRSEAWLSAASNATKIPRGRIVDAALAAIEVCEDCQGAGAVDGPLGPGTETCAGCAGHKIRPCEGSARWGRA